MTTVYKSALIRFFGAEYVKYGWIMQIHFGAMRSPNTIMKNLLGPDTGYDTINGSNCIQALARLLDALNVENALPKTEASIIGIANNNITFHVLPSVKSIFLNIFIS